MIITRRFPLALLGLFVATLAMGSCSKVPLLAPTGSTITVTATATALPVNGATDIIAQVLESAGTPPQNGTVVTFTTTLGSIQPSEARTDGGRVTVRFNAGTTSGTAVITAISGAAGPTTTGTGTGGTTTATTSNKVSIAIGAAAVGSVQVAANPTTLGANGGTATISAVARDASGNGVPGVLITFSTDQGNVSPTLVATGDSGVATTTLVTAATATVTASAGTSTTAATPAAISGTVKVTVTLGPTLNFGAITPNPAIVNQPVSVVVTAAAGTGSPLRGITLNWGDGTSISLGNAGTTAVHTYTARGLFTVTATATDVSGNVSTAQTPVQVVGAPRPTVGLSATAITGTSRGYTFTVTAAVATGAPAGTTIQSVSLDFGDGQTVALGSGASSTAQHVYLGTPGVSTNYTATATVTDSNGQTSTASTVLVVS